MKKINYEKQNKPGRVKPREKIASVVFLAAALVFVFFALYVLINKVFSGGS